mmetsp:Transcript_8412/g.33083  ORF Transcript_8412/g.33083 Transcript_8412/m.33083 type:complete len:256 (+) Transcript_8412:72-839(+)
MFRIALRAACHRNSPATFLVGAAVRLQHRQLNIHEYQGAEILARYGVRVPLGIACQTVDHVHAAAEKLRSDDGDVVLKSQILAGGRGLGHFKNGLQGGVHIVPYGKAQAVGEQMLGQLLVTKQTGEAGKPVNTVLVAQKNEARQRNVLCYPSRSRQCRAVGHCLQRRWHLHRGPRGNTSRKDYQDEDRHKNRTYRGSGKRLSRASWGERIRERCCCPAKGIIRRFHQQRLHHARNQSPCRDRRSKAHSCRCEAQF